MRRLCAAAAVIAVAGAALRAPVLAAQASRNWTNTLTPYAYYTSADGFWIAGHYQNRAPLGFRPRPESYFAAVSLDAAASTQGSFFVVADAEAPAWWEGWRAALTLSIVRDNRLGYYGQGNTTAYSPDSVTPLTPYFYKVSRTHRTGRVTVQRRVIGPLRVLVGGQLDHTDFRELPGRSVFQRDHASGVVDSGSVPFSDKIWRAGVVLDLRDHELDPHRGVLVEGLYAHGTGYTRTTTSLRGWVHPVERLVLAGRLAGERMTGAPPVAAMQAMESSEEQFIAVGGYRSLRGYYDGRFTGPGKLLTSLEARYGLIWAPSLFEVNLVAFYDAARVFGPGETVKVTASGLHRAGGGEVAVRLLRTTLLVLGYGHGPEGGQFLFGTTWSF